MLGLLLGLFRLVWLFGRGHQAVALENLALRQQLSVYKRKHKRPRWSGAIFATGLITNNIPCWLIFVIKPLALE